MKRSALIPAAVAAGAVLAALAVPAVSAVNAGPGTIYGCVSSSHTLTHVSVTGPLSCPSQQPVSWPGTIGGTSPSPSPSPTSASPSPSPTQTASPSPSPTGTASGCTAHLGGGCNFGRDPQIPMSNGFDTYVMDQAVNPQAGTTETITGTSDGSWTLTASDKPYGFTGVQTFPDVQQLANDWDPSTKTWGTGSSDTPLSALSSLQVNYSETSPQDDPGSIYEFAPDVWNDNYGDDVMFWADTSPTRCADNGLSRSSILGQATLGGQGWTVYRYGGAGGEIVFVLDGGSDADPVDNGTCARQPSGSIDVLAGFQWLVNNGYMTTLGTLAQLNTGWEITSADGTTFTMNSYSITAQVAS